MKIQFYKLILCFIGVDSKFGIGLRVGDHADFQILLELGPPQVSDPISNDIYFDLKKDVSTSSCVRKMTDLITISFKYFNDFKLRLRWSQQEKPS